MSLDMENTTVHDVINAIEKKGNFYFTYNLNPVSYTHLGTETSTVFRFVRTFGLAVALRMIFFYDVRP